MPPEAQLERSILTICSAPDILILKNEVGQGFTGNLARRLCSSCKPKAFEHRITYGLGVGSPDLLAVVQGYTVGLELKAASGRVSDDQARWHSAARAKGMRIEVVRDALECFRMLGGVRDEVEARRR